MYLGNSLPGYIPASLSLAQESSGLSLELLVSGRLARNVRRTGIDVIDVEDFYDPGNFTAAAQRIDQSSKFRNGFWQRTLERFFVLDQYVASTGREELLHAELDQVLFRIDHLADALLAGDRRGMFLPFHDPERAIASILFCNDTNVLRSFVDFTTTCSVFTSEMAMLAAWARAQTTRAQTSGVWALPTPATLSCAGPAWGIGENQTPIVSHDVVAGLVDGAQLGQWVAGIDPRNAPLLRYPRTHFVDAPDQALLSRSQLAQMRLFLDEESGELTCQLGSRGSSFRLYNLHIHSKIHSWLQREPGNLVRILNWSADARSRRVPGVKRSQLIRNIGERVGLRLGR